MQGNCPNYSHPVAKFLTQKLGASYADLILTLNDWNIPSMEAAQIIIDRLNSKVNPADSIEIKRQQFLKSFNSFYADVKKLKEGALKNNENILESIAQSKVNLNTETSVKLEKKINEIIEKTQNRITYLENKGKDTSKQKEELEDLKNALSNKMYELGITRYLNSMRDELLKDLNALNNISMKEMESTEKVEYEALKNRIDQLRILIADSKTSKEDREHYQTVIEDMEEEFAKLDSTFGPKYKYASNQDVSNDELIAITERLDYHNAMMTEIAKAIEADKSLGISIMSFDGKKMPLNEIVDKVSNVITEIKVNAEKVSELRFEKALINKGAQYGMDINEDNIEETVSSKKGDVWSITRWLMGKNTTNNKLLDILHAMVSDVVNEAHSVAISDAKRLAKASEKLRKNSKHKVDVVMDKNSKGETTGYLIHAKNTGEFQQDKYELFAAISDLLLIKNADTLSWAHLRNIAKDKGLLKEYKVLKAPFDKKYGNPKTIEQTQRTIENNTRGLEYFNKLGFKYDLSKVTNEEWDAFVKDEYIDATLVNGKVENMGDIVKIKNMIKEKNDAISNLEDNDLITEHEATDNLEFAKLMKDPAFVEFYREILFVHERALAKLPKTYQSDVYKYRLPQIDGDLVQNYMMNNTATFGSVVKEKAKELTKFTVNDIDEYGDGYKYTIGGKVLRTIPIYYISRINPNRLSSNVVGMYSMFSEMASKYEGYSSQLGTMKLIERQMEKANVLDKNGKIIGTGAKSNAYQMFADLMEQEVFGVKEAITEVGGVNINKPINIVSSHATKVNLFGNFASNLSGWITAKTNLTLKSLVGKYSSPESITWANMQMAKYGKDLFTSFGNLTSNSKLINIMEYVGAFGKVQSLSRRQEMSKGWRFTSDNLFFGIPEALDCEVKAKFTLALLDNYRLVGDKVMNKNEFEDTYKNDSSKKWSNYRENSLWNLLEVTPNGLEFKTDKLNQSQKDRLRNRIQNICRQEFANMSGMSSDLDKPDLSRNIFGKMILKHRGFFTLGLYERFGTAKYQANTGENIEGYYVTALRFIFNNVKQINRGFANYQNLSSYEKGNLLRFTADSAYMLMFMMLYGLTQLEPEDEKDDDQATAFLRFLVTRAYIEQRTYWAGTDFLNMLNDPSAMLPFLNNGLSIVTTLFEKDIEGGPYDGYSKSFRGLIKTSPVKNFWELSAVDDKNRVMQTTLGIQNK